MRKKFKGKTKKMIKKFLLILIALFMINGTLFAAESQSPADDSLYTQVRLKNAKPETYDKLDLTCRGVVAKTSSGVELKTKIQAQNRLILTLYLY